MTLQQALLAAEALLCPPSAAQDFPGRVIVFIGESAGSGSLGLRGPCGIAVYGIGTSSEAAPSLRDLADKTQGGYGPLGKTRGFTVASKIKRKTWIPSVHRMLSRQRIVETGEGPSWLGESLTILLIVSVGALALFAIRRAKAGAGPASVSAIVPLDADPGLARIRPCFDAGLKICSERGMGSLFPLNRQEPVIVGGRRHPDSPAHLLIDDPLVSDEHCQIYAEGDALFISDLGSGQGTFVNGEKIAAPMRLAVGDLLQVGGTTFEVVASRELTP